MRSIYLKSAFVCLIALTCMPSYAQDATKKITNDSIYIGDELVGLVLTKGEKKIGVFVESNSLRSFKSERELYPLNSYKTDKYILHENLIIKRDSKVILSKDGEIVGGYLFTSGTVNVTLVTKEITKGFVKYTLWNHGVPKDVPIYVNYDEKQTGKFSKHLKKAIEERERKKLEEQRKKLEEEQEIKLEQERIANEKQRIARFFAQVGERLKGDLDDVEGVYKSIDMGEGVEYDVAILKSQTASREYVGVVLASTDFDMPVGGRIFTLVQTAQSNVYFVQYTTKSGARFENKIGTLNGAILSLGMKSFAKMYPSENDNRKYSEFNPLFDWESSGSGVLINSEGYIATNNHVITGAKQIRISFQNDSIDYEAIIISQNEESDVAIIKITDERFECTLPPLQWETEFNLGQTVFTLGYPISSKMSDNVKVVDGIVSGENGANGNTAYFQTTLPVWYGNSGGPCFNSNGEILGLATQILWDKGEKVDNVAYITKAENVINLAGELISQINEDEAEKSLEELIVELIPYSVFIKVNY